MEVREILVELDREIDRLKTARALLAGVPAGRKVEKSAQEYGARKKRAMSPEGRRRIGEAMKRRWAERKKSAAKGSK